MILVAGGTGTLGTVLVPSLADHGFPLRVLTRHAGSVPVIRGVEAVSGDVREPGSLGPAMRGVQTVVSAVSGFSGKGGVDPRTVDGEGNLNLIRAARAAGVDHFVLVSIHGAAPDHPMEVYRMKHRAERELVSSGLGWTILRPTVSMETWGGIVGSPVLRTGKTRMFGRGTNPINFVSAHDVATVIELTLGDPTLRGQAIDLGGPENLTMRHVVEIFEAAAGRRAKVSHVPLPMLRAMATLMRPFNPTLARFAQAGVFMDTADMSFDASEQRVRFPSVSPTRMAEVVRRDAVESPDGDGRESRSHHG